MNAQYMVAEPSPAQMNMKIQLVLPEDSNSEQKRVSILTPMGSALIGYAEKDKIMWDFPNGTHEVEILKVVHSQF